jgi:Alpha/beta hydrolase domain
MLIWKGLAAAGALLLACVSVASAQTVVSGPIAATAPPGDPSRDYPFFASQFDLKARGYVEEEYFIEGTANRYSTPGTATGTVIDSGHPYKTRIIVRRPVSAKAFNGTVLIEWINVTNNLDMENTWFQIHEHVLRSGYAWVGVSAQRLGVNRLRTWNPNRYGTLDVSKRNAAGAETITNDALSYDILTHVAQAVRQPGGNVDVLGSGLSPRTIIATGHSQSAMRLVTYVNAIQPLSHAFDAFALHGSLGNPVRTDLEVPTWKVLSEYDVRALEARVRQPDADLFRTWEVTGTSHNDRQSYASRVFLQKRDLGTAVEDSLNCTIMPPGSAVPFHFVMSAGLDHLVRWVRQGTPMPAAPRIELTLGPPVVLTKDEIGNVLGGIRLSQVAVPIAVSSGTNTGPGTCDRWGFTDPLDAATLDALYRNHGKYVSQVTNTTERNVANGYILPADAQQTIKEAAKSKIGKP